MKVQFKIRKKKFCKSLSVLIVLFGFSASTSFAETDRLELLAQLTQYLHTKPVDNDGRQIGASNLKESDITLVSLKKNTPAYIFLSNRCVYDDCEQGKKTIILESAASGEFSPILALPMYASTIADGVDSSVNYFDEGQMVLGHWTEQGNRGIVLKVHRTDRGSSPRIGTTDFEKTYEWVDNKLCLVQQKNDGRIIVERADILVLLEAEQNCGKQSIQKIAPVLIKLIGNIDFDIAKRATHAYMICAQDSKAFQDPWLTPFIVKKLSMGNEAERKGSLYVLEQQVSKGGASVLSTAERSTLLSSVSAFDPYLKIRLLNLLATIGEQRALPHLLTAFEASLRSRDECLADDALRGVGTLEQKKIPFSDSDIKRLKAAKNSGLGCGDGEDLDAHIDSVLQGLTVTGSVSR